MRSALIILRLGIKEIFSLARDPVLLGLVFYAFVIGVYTAASSNQSELHDAAIAIVDEDDSLLSHRLRGAFLPPYFKSPAIIDIPENFEADVQRGRAPAVQVDIDATAMSIAGNGSSYISSIIQQEVAKYVSRSEPESDTAASLQVRVKFNPNLDAVWFNSVMEMVKNISIMAIILTGAAVIREREHGTIEHLLVMPVSPIEIMIAKIWANGFVIIAATLFSLQVVIHTWLGVPIAGSLPLFAVGACVFLFSITALGIMLATLTNSMPQFSLLSIPVIVVLNLLSGSQTPLESMPDALRYIMQASPATHFVSFSQSVIYRDAPIDLVWPDLLAMFVIGCVFFALALSRFRASMAAR